MYWEVGIKIGAESGQVTVHPAAYWRASGAMRLNTHWRWRLPCIQGSALNWSMSRSLTMSNQQNEGILERLYDEAYEELRPDYIFREEYELHYAAVDLAKQRWENDYE